MTLVKSLPTRSKHKLLQDRDLLCMHNVTPHVICQSWIRLTMALTDFSEILTLRLPLYFQITITHVGSFCPLLGISLFSPASGWPGGYGYKVYSKGLPPSSNHIQVPFNKSSCTMLSSHSFLLSLIRSQILKLTIHQSCFNSP